MGSLPVKPPTSRDTPWFYLAMGALLFAAALAASLAAKPSVRATIDGTARRVESGMTLADVGRMGYLEARPGRVVAVSGRLLEQSSGAKVRVWRNARIATDDQTVYDGDVITSADGRDVVEDVVVKQDEIPVPVKMVGSGPLIAVSTPGSPGLKETRVGAASGEVVTSTVITQPTSMVVRRYGKQTRQKLVALTFDDGPWPGQTDRILRVLHQYKVKATFFMLGYLARNNASLAHQVAAQGHLVGNHTMGHKKLTALSAAAVDRQISSAEARIISATGQTPEWLRPPGGYISPSVWSRARKASLKVALWSVDPQDWRRLPSTRITHDVVTRVRPGSIVLLHDGGGDRTQTIKALPGIIRLLKARGYRFVTLDEMPQP